MISFIVTCCFIEISNRTNYYYYIQWHCDPFLSNKNVIYSLSLGMTLIWTINLEICVILSSTKTAGLPWCKNLWYFLFVLLACAGVWSLFNGLLALLFSFFVASVNFLGSHTEDEVKLPLEGFLFQLFLPLIFQRAWMWFPTQQWSMCPIRMTRFISD